MLMSEFEIITDGGRRRHWTAADKLRIVEETLDEPQEASQEEAPKGESAPPKKSKNASGAAEKLASLLSDLDSDTKATLIQALGGSIIDGVEEGPTPRPLYKDAWQFPIVPAVQKNMKIAQVISHFEGVEGDQLMAFAARAPLSVDRIPMLEKGLLVIAKTDGTKDAKLVDLTPYAE